MLSLIIPCYNEQDNVKRFFDEVNTVFAGRVLDYEFVFVDDGSKDDTAKNLRQLYRSSSNAKIQIITFSRNFGKESAIYAGLENCKGDYAVIIDADLQQRPEVVLDMLSEMSDDESLDCVAAYQDKRKENKLVAGMKSCYYKAINKLSEMEFVDGASDFRLMRRAMIDAILDMTEYHRFSKGIFSWVGFNTKYIPYEVDERHSGETKWSNRKLLRYAIEGLFAFSTAPVHFATYVGLASSALAMIYMVVVILQKLIFGINVPGYPTLVALILFIGGIQLFCMGILGEYISKIYIQVKNRPIYILKEHLDNEKD